MSGGIVSRAARATGLSERRFTQTAAAETEIHEIHVEPSRNNSLIAQTRIFRATPLRDARAVINDRPGLCDILAAHRDYFRNAPEAYEALIMMVPLGYLGTFIIGREGTDAPTAAEIVATSGKQPTTPFHALNNSYIALTNWADNGGNATGSFSLGFDDPYNSGTAHPFYGRFKTSFCSTLEGTLLP